MFGNKGKLSAVIMINEIAKKFEKLHSVAEPLERTSIIPVSRRAAQKTRSLDMWSVARREACRSKLGRSGSL